MGVTPEFYYSECCGKLVTTTKRIDSSHYSKPSKIVDMKDYHCIRCGKETTKTGRLKRKTMAKNKNQSPKRPPSMDERITNLLKEGPLVAFYFSAAITQFKEQIEQVTDEQIAEMVENLLHPTTVRNCVKHIYNRLNLIEENPDE